MLGGMAFGEMISAGRVNTDGGTSAAGFGARGCAVARTGAGVYTITPDRQCDAGERCCFVQVELTDRLAFAVQTSDSVITVTTETVAGVDTDSTWSFGVFRFSGGTGK